MRWWVALLFLFICSLSYVSGVRINEVELNPPGDDNYNEWIELYSDSQIDIINWRIENAAGKNMSFNASFSNYYVFNTSYSLLTNTNQKIKLFDSNGTLISETAVINDSYDDIRTWQYCSGWVLLNSSRGLENICTSNDSLSNQTNNTTNNQTENNQTANSTANATTKTSFSIDAAKNITYGDELEIKIVPDNFASVSYDLKIFISFQDDIISEIYNGGWKSGVYYVPYSGNNQIRIKSSYSDVRGDGSLVVRLRESGKSDYIEKSLPIEILEYSPPENVSEEVSSNIADKIVIEENASKEDVIVLNSNPAAAISGEVIYESKNEKIRQYSVYAFCVFLIFLIAIILLKR